MCLFNVFDDVSSVVAVGVAVQASDHPGLLLFAAEIRHLDKWKSSDLMISSFPL